jgi:hypothetical protein
MIADLIIDFDNHLKHNKVYLVELELPLQDAPEDVPNSITADVYVIANNYYQAQYIANTMYPDISGVSVHEDPITEQEYATRRNRSLL